MRPEDANAGRGESRKPAGPALKAVLEIGPLVIFFAVNAYFGIFAGTGAFMAASALSLTLSYVLMGTVALVPLVSAVVVLVFGGLTLILSDETFIKLKPTIVNALFAAALLGGLAFGRSLLRPVLSASFALTAEGWRLLTLRWGLFFAGMAGLNELVWRNVSTDTWVAFKLFGLVPLALLFALAQTGLLRRHALAHHAADANPPEECS